MTTTNPAYCVSPNLGDNFTNAMPVASIITYAGTTAPTGYLMCIGSAVSRSVYPNLFNVIGTTYGVGNGTTTFNVPDMRDRTQRGSGSTFTLAQTGGADTVTISADNLPQHTHGVDNALGYSATGLGNGATGNFIRIGTVVDQTTPSQTFLNNTTRTLATNSAVGIINKYIAVNYIIKT